MGTKRIGLSDPAYSQTMFETYQHPGHRCKQNGTVCCSEEGPDLVLWSIIRLLEGKFPRTFQVGDMMSIGVLLKPIFLNFADWP
jgi:hypothetical protein